MNEPDVLPILFFAFVKAVTVSPKAPLSSAVMSAPVTAHTRAPRSCVGM